MMQQKEASLRNHIGRAYGILMHVHAELEGDRHALALWLGVKWSCWATGRLPM